MVRFLKAFILSLFSLIPVRRTLVLSVGSPSHHRLHHGSNDIYLNKNYGNTLIIWDKLFGTFQAEDEPVVFGITRPFTSTNPVWANINFWKEILKSTKNKKGFFNKLQVFFLSPADLSEKKLVSAKEVHINLAVPTWLKWYLILQFPLWRERLACALTSLVLMNKR